MGLSKLITDHPQSAQVSSTTPSQYPRCCKWTNLAVGVWSWLCCSRQFYSTGLHLIQEFWNVIPFACMPFQNLWKTGVLFENFNIWARQCDLVGSILIYLLSHLLKPWNLPRPKHVFKYRSKFQNFGQYLWNKTEMILLVSYRLNFFYDF